VNGLLGGWNFNGTIFAHSGVPYTVMDYNATYGNYAFFNAPAQPLGPGATFGGRGCGNPDVACFDPNAFLDTNVAMLSGFPTQRRNQYRGPSFFIANFSPTKSFNLTERMKLNVGANFYNIFNNVNFNVPNFGLTSTDKGWDSGVGNIQSTISVPASPYGSFMGSAASARIIQLQARITF
jgi:hypothetical protein